MKRALAWLVLLTLVLTAVPAHAMGFGASTPLDEGCTNRNDNIRRAAWMLNQTTLGYGETFSFNETVGPRGEAQGYSMAPNGTGANVIGGGVGQAASTLYLALLAFDPGLISFTELHTYGERFTQSYVESGDLAVIVSHDSGKDFRFVNCAADEMIIEMWQSGGELYCTVSLSDGFAWDTDASHSAASPAYRHIATAEITCGDDESLLHNIALAADSITDTTLLPGDVFSFNTIVGPRESRYGYVPAVNGRGVEVIGGGVAQTASAVWLAIKNHPDVSIVSKSTYGTRYNQSYVSSPADAILTDYAAGTDFVFRNTGSATLTLYTWLEGNVLRCALYEAR